MEDRASPALILVVDDHALVREGMRTLLDTEPDLEVVGEAADGREAVKLCRKLCPDLVLMDVRMPRMDGLEATRAIKAECPQTSILIVTTHESPDYLLEAVKGGAVGYVLKDATRQQLLKAVRRSLEGEFPLDQQLVMHLLKRLASEADNKPEQTAHESIDRRGEDPLPDPLTERELEVLRWLVLGKTNREVAQALRVSLSTVKAHVQRIIAKLGVSDRTQAAVRAVELRLIPGGE